MIKPLGTYALLKQYKEEKPQGALILPDSANQNDGIYECLDFGVAVEGIGLIEIGSKVLIKRYSHILFKHEDNEYFLVDYKDIIAVLK